MFTPKPPKKVRQKMLAQKVVNPEKYRKSFQLSIVNFEHNKLEEVLPEIRKIA